MLESAWLTNLALASPGSGFEGSRSGLLEVGLILILLVIVGVAVKAFDLRRKRTEAAVHLQAAISDALLREPALFGLPITPTAHLPLWRGAPATIAVSGTVPTSERREAVLRLVKAEASRIRPDFAIDDRLAILPKTHAAS